MQGTELPGYKKKSFSMPFCAAEIWFEHLDGIYEFTDLALSKFREDYERFKKPSVSSLIAINLDETVINDELIKEISYKLINCSKCFLKVVFIGVKRQEQKKIKKEMSNRSFALAFINDFEKAKEWLVSKSGF